MVQLTPHSGWSIVLGLTLGLGLWSLVSLLPRLSRPRLIHRVAPYLVDVSPAARDLLARRTVEPLPVV
ncbi:MAG: pilus assembly protein, partial [Lacisediminihabitans sp.]